MSAQMFAADGGLHARTPTRSGLATPVGRRDVRPSRCSSDAFELAFEELDIRQEGGERKRDVAISTSDNYGPLYTLWNSLDDGAHAPSSTRRWSAFFESYRSGDGISVERRYIVVTGRAEV